MYKSVNRIPVNQKIKQTKRIESRTFNEGKLNQKPIKFGAVFSNGINCMMICPGNSCYENRAYIPTLITQ